MPTSLVRITAIGSEILNVSGLAAAGEFIETDSVASGSRKIRIQNLKTILELDRVSNTSDSEKGVSPAVAAAIAAAALGGLTAFDLSSCTNLSLDKVNGVTGILPVAHGGTGVSTSTGSGSVVKQTSPALITPDLGTPSTGDLQNCYGLRLDAGVSNVLPVANGGTGTTTSTGTGSVVLSASPVFSGSIGVGTSSPSANLHVTGTGLFGSVGIGNNITAGISSDSVHLALRAPSGSTFIQSASGASTFVTVNNVGNVGVGTPSPVAKLHVAGTAQFDGHVTLPINPAAANAVRKDYVDNLIATYSQGIPYPYVNKIKFVNINTDDHLFVAPIAEPGLPRTASAFMGICFYGTYSSNTNVLVAGSSGNVYAGLKTLNGYVYNRSFAPEPYPRCLSITVTNDGGGPNYFVIRSDGYIEVEFRLGPNLYRRMRWNGNVQNWQYGSNLVFSASMATSSPNALVGSGDYGVSPVIHEPSIDYGTYSTPSNFAD